MSGNLVHVFWGGGGRAVAERQLVWSYSNTHPSNKLFASLLMGSWFGVCAQTETAMACMSDLAVLIAQRHKDLEIKVKDLQNERRLLNNRVRDPPPASASKNNTIHPCGPTPPTA